jgi:hypothetical protein
MCPTAVMLTTTILGSQVYTPGPEPVGPPAIARVRLPSGEICYVPHARNYRGFLVQRQYVGVGQPRYSHEPSVVGRVGRIWTAFDTFTPHRRPVLFAAALAATGLDYAAVAAWIKRHRDEVFDHPTYAGLCLRWGSNAHGYHVEPAEEESIGEVDAVSFTLRTDGRAGCTHYHLQTLLDTQSALFHELCSQAGLKLGEDEEFANGYSTQNYAAAQRIVHARGLEWVWQQRYSVYEVTVHFPEAHRSPLHARFATAEEARQWYDHLPSTSAPEAACPIATLSRAEKLEDERYADRNTAQKCLPVEWQGTGLPRPAKLTAPTARRADLTAWDLPPDEATTTVAGLLDAKGLGLGELGRQVGIYYPTIYKRAHNPRAWTVDNLLAIADYTQRPVSEILDLLMQEMNSWR